MCLYSERKTKAFVLCDPGSRPLPRKLWLTICFGCAPVTDSGDGQKDGGGGASRSGKRKLLQGTATSEPVGPASTSCSATTVGAGCSPPAPGAADATAGESSPAAATAGLAGAGTSSANINISMQKASSSI